MLQGIQQNATTTMVADIVSAYVSHNSVPVADLPAVIADVDRALRGLGTAGPEPAPAVLVPAVPIRKSVFPDYIVCLIDGRRYTSMKRHLAKLGYTPESYRKAFGLPDDYPMVPKNYSKRRSELAKLSGLGVKPRDR